MNWIRRTAPAVLTSLAFLMFPAAGLHGQSCPGRFWRNSCWYRVFYRTCPTQPWCYYGSYNDCRKAQSVVNYLHLEGCEAFYRPV
jgi:hypothetical protein